MTIEEAAPIPPPGAENDSAAQIERLFRAHNESLLRFLALRLGSQQDAKEVAQEAYVKLLSLAEPGTISFLRAFLFTTAANLATDRMRARLRRPATSARLFDELCADAPSPEQQISSEQELTALHPAGCCLLPRRSGRSDGGKGELG